MELHTDKSIRDYILDNAKKRNECWDEFLRIFRRPLSDFWEGNLLGFDVIEFDEWLQPPDGTSTRDIVEQKYGTDGVKLIERLLA